MKNLLTILFAMLTFVQGMDQFLNNPTYSEVLNNGWVFYPNSDYGRTMVCRSGEGEYMHCENKGTIVCISKMILPKDPSNEWSFTIRKEPLKAWSGSLIADYSELWQKMAEIYLCTDYSPAKITQMLQMLEDELDFNRHDPFLFYIICAGKTIVFDDLILYSLWPDHKIPASRILIPLLTELPQIVEDEQEVTQLVERILADAVRQAA
jgi:hypothetical protein